MKILPLVALLCFGAITFSCASNLVFWYQMPSITTPTSPLINSALPVGNGRIGGLIAGGAAHERIVLNEDSLWLGGANPSGNDGTMGAYQMLGSVLSICRDMKIFQIIAATSTLATRWRTSVIRSNGVKFSREYFCSHADNVLVVRLTADKPGSYSGSIELDDSHGAQTVADKNRLTDAGALNNGLKYEAQLLAVNDGGSLQTNGATLEFTNCDRLTLFIAAGTDYAMDYAKNYRGEDPHARVTEQVETAAKKNYAVLKAAHEKDFHSLFDRVALDLGKSSPEQIALPTDKRKILAADDRLTRSLKNCFSNMAAIF